MSQIAPDIPELRAVPPSARSIVYVAALRAAMRSPATLSAGALLILAMAAAGATPGYRLLGIFGAAIGATLGLAAAMAVCLKVLLPWRARRLVPEILRHTDARTFEPIARADEAVARMIHAYKERERD